MEDIQKPVSKARLADIILYGLPGSYDALRLQANIGNEFNLSKIKHTACSMFITSNRASRQSNNNKQSMRDSLMLAATASDRREQAGHKHQATCYGWGKLEIATKRASMTRTCITGDLHHHLLGHDSTHGSPCTTQHYPAIRIVVLKQRQTKAAASTGNNGTLIVPSLKWRIAPSRSEVRASGQCHVQKQSAF